MALSLLTVGTVNHAAGIRVVLETFAEHHPGAQLFTCLVDGGALRGGDLRLPGIVFLPEDLRLPGGRRFLFKFDAFELCTALKPFAAAHVLQRYNVDKLVYLDSDIMVVASLADSLATGWRAGNILCTPHFVEWPEDSAEHLRQVRQCGTYNTGFFAVDRSFEAMRFLSWWGAMCSEMGIYEPATGRFVDQIWLITARSRPERGVLEHGGTTPGQGRISMAGQPAALEIFPLQRFRPETLDGQAAGHAHRSSPCHRHGVPGSTTGGGPREAQGHTIRVWYVQR